MTEPLARHPGLRNYMQSQVRSMYPFPSVGTFAVSVVRSELAGQIGVMIESALFSTLEYKTMPGTYLK